MSTADEIAEALRGEFIDDAQDRLSKIQLALNDLASSKADPTELLIDLSRQLHNIKGTGAAFGFPALSSVSHRFKDFLGFTMGGELPIEDFQRFTDVMIDLLEEGHEPDEAKVSAMMRDLPVAIDFYETSVTANPGHALVVTRARTMAVMLARELSNCGFRAHTTADPFEAIRYATMEAPDVVLASAVLEGLGGVDLALAIKAMRKTKTLPVAVVTSFDKDHKELEGVPSDVGIVRLGDTLSDDLGELLTNTVNM